MQNPTNSVSDCFELTCDAVTADFQVDVAVQPQPVDSPASKCTALILEDDEAQLQILEQYVTSIGLKSISAMTLAEARQALQDEPVHIGLFDIQLPDGSGFELCREIDENATLVGLPVILLSNMQQDSVVRETRASGGSFFLSKPYDPNVLLTLIERVLNDVM